MNAVFKALNDVTRREILELLKDKEMQAGEIAAYFAISKPSISHHLDLLKQGNLILAEKKGQYIIYSLNRSGFELVHAWFQGFAQYFEFPKPKIRL